MLEFCLGKEYETVSKSNPFNLKYNPLKHQQATFQALQNNQIVINLHNTGTGKTLAALLYLFAIDTNVLFIAPTNELIRQHARDIQEFVDENNLKYNVINVDASLLKKLTSSAKRNGDKLHRLLNNPWEFASELELKLKNKNYPFVFVTNPDIFYYALFFQYHDIDQRNLCQDFSTLFSYIIIDEFHYYNSKQFANFLFFFALSKEFGYFEAGRKICLLSATPAEYVINYLQQLNLDMEIIDLEKENKITKLPVLTKTEVKIISGNLIENKDLVKNEVQNYLQQNRDGVIISNSLDRINRFYTDLDWQDKGRITGPESSQSRKQANQKSLILATPTVDIGYNFDKKEKRRQNIDFVVLEAKSVDELLQRIGRTGRILGKEKTDKKSQALVLVDENSYNRLAEKIEQREYGRQEFADLLIQLNAPPQNRVFIQYINSYACLETFYPLYQMYCSMPDHIKDYIKKLFNLLKDIFGGNKSFCQLLGVMSKYRHQKYVIEKDQTLSIKDFKDFMYWFGDDYSEAEIKKYAKNPGVQSSVKEFIKQEYALKKSLFNFRDSFNGPKAVIYDPQSIFTREKTTTYNLFHIIRNYQYSLFDSQSEFKEKTKSNSKGDFYLQLNERRNKEEKVKLSYTINVPFSLKRQDFEEKLCNRPVALSGLSLTANIVLAPEIIDFFQNEYIPMLLLNSNTPRLISTLYSVVKNTTIYPQQVEVNFPDYSNIDYYAVMGTAAFLVYPELKGAIYAAEREKEDLPIII